MQNTQKCPPRLDVDKSSSPNLEKSLNWVNKIFAVCSLHQCVFAQEQQKQVNLNILFLLLKYLVE